MGSTLFAADGFCQSFQKDVMIMEKNDTVSNTMKPKQKKRPTRARTFDNHYRSDADEYELIARIAHSRGVSVAEYTRSRLIPPNPYVTLSNLRRGQRAHGDPDHWFTHPKLKKAS